ncbi:glycosyltransferase family 2 protein [Candidatus Micrarchaeota archaeon]|nr:glycosyltransferase family 2 protein [Candidatus Micrarchaeota archaeon]
MLMAEAILNILTYISAFILTYFSVFLIFIYLERRNYVENYKGKTKWEPTVSVIIPVYNEEKEVGRCIESVLNLDYPKDKLEIIVVDDCSTDNSYQIAKQYEKYGVKVLKTPKNGGCAAKTKNYGVRFANGEVLAFLDSDSFVEKDTLKKMLPYFEEGVGAVTPAVRIWNPKTVMEQLQYIEYEVILFLRRVLMAVEAVYVTPGPFSIFTRKAFEEVGGYDNKSLTEDHEIALHIQAKGYLVRSTFDANVHTVPPKTITGWIKQRTRWLRGGLYNRIKHFYLLNILKYGDFGLLAIALDMILFIPIFLMIIGPILNILFYDHWVERLGVLGMLYSIDALWGVGIVVTVLSILWFIHIWKFISKYSPKYKIKWWVWPIHLFIYSTMWGYIWLFVIWKEVTRQKMAWETR